MAIEHRNIPSAECHEPKGIALAGTADSGKVITPSSVAPGVSELRRLSVDDLVGGDSLSDTIRSRSGMFTFTNLHTAKSMFAYLPTEDVPTIGFLFYVVTEAPLPSPVNLIFRVGGQVAATLTIPAGAPEGTVHEGVVGIPGIGPKTNPLIEVESGGYAGGTHDAVVTFRYQFAQLKA